MFLFCRQSYQVNKPTDRTQNEFYISKYRIMKPSFDKFTIIYNIKHHTVLAFPELPRGVCRVKTGTIHKKGGKRT